ncbi:MAG: hypothetical protein WCW31_05345 [Patescibacteria group bacterium]
MSLFPTPGLAEEIVQVLRRGPLEIEELRGILAKQGKAATKQGIYKALRFLRQHDMVLLVSGEAQLNVRWLQRMQSFVSFASRAYFDPTLQEGHFLQLRDGDRIQYSFKNPVQVDIFWNHVLYILFEAMPKLDRWYAYASHNWFLLARRSEELQLKNYMLRHGMRYLFTAGHRLPLDRSIAAEFDGVMSQYHMLEKPLFPKKKGSLGTVLNIVGDYVIEALYDKQTAAKIEKFYATHDKRDKKTIFELEAIVAQPAKIRFVIQKNSAKAEKLTRLFEKNFYFKKLR